MARATVRSDGVRWPSPGGDARVRGRRFGAQLRIAEHAGTRYYDLWNGVELKPEVQPAHVFRIRRWLVGEKFV